MIWVDELLFASMLLGFILGVILRFVKDDSRKIILEVIGWVVQGVIVVLAAVFSLLILGIMYLIAAAVTCMVVYFSIEPVVNRLKLAIQSTETADAVTPRSAGRAKPMGRSDSKVIQILEQKFGLGFEPIHAGVIWAISENRTSEKDIATFLNISPSEVRDAIKFMRNKKMTIFYVGVTRKAKVSYAKEILEKARKFFGGLIIDC